MLHVTSFSRYVCIIVICIYMYIPTSISVHTDPIPGVLVLSCSFIIHPRAIDISVDIAMCMCICISLCATEHSHLHLYTCTCVFQGPCAGNCPDAEQCTGNHMGCCRFVCTSRHKSTYRILPKHKKYLSDKLEDCMTCL